MTPERIQETVNAFTALVEDDAQLEPCDVLEIGRRAGARLRGDGAREAEIRLWVGRALNAAIARKNDRAVRCLQEFLEGVGYRSQIDHVSRRIRLQRV